MKKLRPIEEITREGGYSIVNGTLVAPGKMSISPKSIPYFGKEIEPAEAKLNNKIVYIYKDAVLDPEWFEDYEEENMTKGSCGAVKKTYSTRTFWETDMEIIDGCGKVAKDFHIFIMPLAKAKIESLMKEYKSLEWLAYLIGEIDWEKEKAVVRDLYIPEQTISAAAVNNVGPVNMETVGVIHSHHSMGAFFSGTDDDYINQNNDISIVVAHDGMKAQVRAKTPCGAYAIVDASVSIDLGINFDSDGFIKEIKDKLKRHTYKYGKYYNRSYYGYGSGYLPRGGYYQNNTFWDTEEESTEKNDTEIKVGQECTTKTYTDISLLEGTWDVDKWQTNTVPLEREFGAKAIVTEILENKEAVMLEIDGAESLWPIDWINFEEVSPVIDTEEDEDFIYLDDDGNWINEKRNIMD